jgi:metal-responsive CopG/Arc/MetJ family transcriptional regulator
MTTQIAVRLPEELLDQLDALVPSAHASRSEAIRCAIEEYLYRQACERDARLYESVPLSEAELALADDPEAWSGTPPW